MDLSKAFDTIDHSILLHKLQYYGLYNTELNWFRSYLCNRKQFVSLENTNSSFLNISTGVPQGSILGPLLFLIYVNDLCNSTDAKTIMYADDTCLLLPFFINSKSDISSQTLLINSKLDRVFKWLCANKLSLNTDKTKFMLFHFAQKKIQEHQIPKIKINNSEIKRVESFKFLGIFLDESLNWNKHVTEISNKISKIVGVLSILKHYFPSHVLLTMYNSRLNFGITLWGFNHCHRLKVLQKRALRIIVKAPFFAHTKPICKKINTLLLDDIFTLNCLKFYCKYKQKELPSYFYNSQFIETYYSNRNTRSTITLPSEYSCYVVNTSIIRPILKMPLFQKASSQKCLKYHIAHLINTLCLPQTILDKFTTHSIESISKRLKKHIIDSYPLSCNTKDCLFCSSN